MHPARAAIQEWIGATVGAPFNLVRWKAREEGQAGRRPALSFGDVVGLVVHDWEGAHGKGPHGPLVEIAGQRFRTVGDERLIPAVDKFTQPMTDANSRRC